MVEEKKGFINTIFHEGNIDTLYGPPGAGKTNCAVFLTEKAVDLGYNIFTTIHFFKYEQVGQACNAGRLPTGVTYRRVPPEVQTVTTLSQLLFGLLSQRKNIVVLDEAGIFASSTAPMSTRVRELKELSFVIRHLNSSLLLIAQARGSIAPDLRSTLVTYELRIKRLSKFYRTLIVKRAISITNPLGEEEISFVPIGPTIGKIPLTRYPWDGFFIPKFDFDIKLKDAFDRLGEYNSLEVIDLGPKIIKELMEEVEEGENENGYEKKKTKMQERHDAIRNEFLTMKESGVYSKRSDILAALARKYEKSYNWAYQICRDLF